MFIKEFLNILLENIIEILVGNYLCFKVRILSEIWNFYFVKFFFYGKEKFIIVLVNEYENNFYEYLFFVYEL